MNLNEIKQYIPHRYPFLMVDKVEELVENSHIVAYKYVSGNESYFQGHFPEIPVMPGVLTFEAMAQAAGILSAKSLGPDSVKDLVFLLAGAERIRYKTPIFPASKIKIEVKILRVRRGLWQYEGKASVNDNIACEAVFFCTGASKQQFSNSF